MNGANSEGTNKGRVTRTFKVAPTTRAIRAALAVSATVLALSGSGVAFAAVGVCAPAPVPFGTVDCDGVFDTANANVPIAYAVDDLTVILGGVDPLTTVTTAGVDGINLSGVAGDETLFNYGSITTADTYAVDISSVSGDVTASIRAAGQISAQCGR